MNREYIEILNKELNPDELTVEKIEELANSNYFKDLLGKFFGDTKEIRQSLLDNLTDNNAVQTLIQEYVDNSDIRIIDDYSLSEEMSSMSTYINEIHRYPLLTAIEEHDLAMKFYNKNDPEAKERFFCSNLRLVISIAKKYSNRGVDLEDLVSQGNLGLMTAVDRFDPTKGTKFSTYATWWIRQVIRRYIDDTARTIRYPVHLCQTISRINKFIYEYKLKYAVDPDDETIMKELDINEDTFMCYKMSLIKNSSLDQNVAEGDHSESTLGEFVEDTKVDVFESAYKPLLEQGIDEAMKRRLTPREYQIIRLRFGFDDGEEKTLEQVGDKFGVTRERIRQIEAKALRTLRNDSKMKSYNTK
ncbi:MAG TPA: sigma-70 family RNA polymerase sigma factor [Bacilli bacterium]|jgi:RNA polymerase primary sigma factor|nr:sigma-70 family RNA polymerase sigma factor [Bacilli bacterium]